MADQVIHGNPQVTGTGAAGTILKPNGTTTIRSFYKPTDEQVQTLNHVYNKRFTAMKDSPDRKEAEKNWDKWEKQWEAYRIPQTDTGQEPWMSNHVVPMTLSIVETALSEMIRQNLRPLVLPWGTEDVPKAKVMEHIWEFLWSISQGDMTIYGIFKDLLMYGTAIGQEYYLKDRRMIRETKLDQKGKATTKEKEIFDYDDCMLEQVKLQDFYVDEYARGFDGPYKARDCIRRYIMDIDDFHTMYDGSQWDQFDNAKLVRPGGDTEYYEYFKPPQGMISNNQVEVLHYWAEKPHDQFVIVANDIVVRDGSNPYKHKKLPFLRAVDIKRPHKFYCKGEPELLESVQNEADTLRRMIIDRNHLDIDKMFFVSNRLGLSDEDLIARPHGMIPTDDVNGAKAVEYGDIPRSVEMSLSHLGDDSIISTGINPRAQALPQAGTATEAAILQASTVRRIEMKLWLFKKEFMPRLGMLRSSNIIQFYSQPRLEEIIGEKNSDEYKQECADLQAKGMLYQPDGGDPMKMSYRSIPIKGKTLSVGTGGQLNEQRTPGYSFFELKPGYFIPERGGYWFKFEAGSNLDTSKPLQQQKDLELFDRFVPIAQAIPNSYDIVKLGDMILEDYGKNPDDYKPDNQNGGQGQDEDAQRTQVLAQIAQMENKQMMSGKDVPATPYADQGHTLVHLTFMRSKPFQDLPNDSSIIKVFTTHVTGEIMAQESRNMSGAVPPPGAPQQPGGPQQAPQQGPVPQGGAGNGTMNKPGGMAKPSLSMQDVMPNLSVGGNMQKR